MTPLSGVLVVDKPSGPTSFDVVARVRRAFGARKAGHAGTLDPAATGVLVVCLDDGVRLQHFLTEGDKAYRATVAFGAATSTEDAEGEVIAEGDPSALTEGDVRAALARFVGEIEQVPPMFSAVRVGGRRLHEAARAGEEVERAPRRVRVDALELVSLAPPPARPEPFDGPAAASSTVGGGRVEGRGRVRQAVIDVRCGKGTYVRTLAADLGRALRVPAHLAALRRTRSSGFGIEQAIGLEELERRAREDGAQAVRDRVIPPARALELPAARTTPAEAADLAHGRSIPAGGHGDGVLVQAIDPGDRLVAVCEVSGGRLRPVRVFLTPAEL